MNTMSVGGASGGTQGGASRAGFDALLADAARDAGSVAAQSGAAAPGPAVRMDIGRGSAMPSEEEFVLIDDVEMQTDANGEEVAVVKGEAVSEGQAKVAAAEGGSVILPLSSPRLQSRSIAGSMFAGMLLDQRSGVLPNPFSLMRIPERAPVDPAAQSGAVGGAGGIPPVSAITASSGPEAGALQDAPAQDDALAMGKELSRLESAIAALIERIEGLVRSLKSLIGSLGRGHQG